MAIRLLFLWHMHQPFYKDLVTGEYRLPWVRMHALKDYFGMVKLLDEFPGVQQTFNLVPSLLVQLEDYVAGAARDPQLEVAAKPVAALSPAERSTALRYLFQANSRNQIARYPRYAELETRMSAYRGRPELAAQHFTEAELTDLQVLSQLAWLDEYAFTDPEVARLVRKGRGFDGDDQAFIVGKERELLAAVIPQYRLAQERGQIELSTSPFYHPILPLLCDTGIGAVSSPGLSLPMRGFRRPEDAREQLQRALHFHAQRFGGPPRGVWPSEGSVSEEALALAAGLGVEWMASDEGVLGRTLGANFARDPEGALAPQSAAALYKFYRYERGETRMDMLFRDHSLSDLIGFVYSSMPAREAAAHFIAQLKRSTEPVRRAGADAVVPVILDGENAWEYFPGSGREFLRELYARFQSDPEIEPLTVSGARARLGDADFGRLGQLVPGSWINSNFNIWIGAPEDNRAWDYLSEARDFYERRAGRVPEAKRRLAYEELLIAEGSDWNWWYGPEHSSANDREFDELFRQHLSNVYRALGDTPPDYLAQPIAMADTGDAMIEQSGHIHPRMDGAPVGYFEWIGAARYRARGEQGAMHGKEFLLTTGYAGMDATYLYARLDLSDAARRDPRLQKSFEIVQAIECFAPDGEPKEAPVRLIAAVANSKKESWRLDPADDPRRMDHRPGAMVLYANVFESRITLAYLHAAPGDRLRIRFSLWREGVPLDALPPEGAIEVQVLDAEQLRLLTVEENWKA